MEKWEDWRLGEIPLPVAMSELFGIILAKTSMVSPLRGDPKRRKGPYPAIIGLTLVVKHVLAGEASLGAVQECSEPVTGGSEVWPRPIGQRVTAGVV